MGSHDTVDLSFRDLFHFIRRGLAYALASVRATLDTLRRIGVRVLGIAATNLEERQQRQGRYGYGYGYGYGESELAIAEREANGPRTVKLGSRRGKTRG